jgi:hypothetical protein
MDRPATQPPRYLARRQPLHVQPVAPERSRILRRRPRQVKATFLARGGGLQPGLFQSRQQSAVARFGLHVAK